MAVTWAPQAFEVVRDAAGLAAVAADVRASRTIGLATQTTGPDPRVDRVRLIQLATAAGVFVLDVGALDDARAELADLFAALADVEVVGHDLLPDLQFLARLGFVPGTVYDTMLSSQVLHAGRDDEYGRPLRHSLADVARRELRIFLDETELEFDWWEDGLTDEQLGYAADAADILLPLADGLRAKLEAAGLTATDGREMRALPGVAWAAAEGVGFDRIAWEAQAAAAERERCRLEVELGGMDPMGGDRNWDSRAEVREALAAAREYADSAAGGVPAGLGDLIAAKVCEYRGAAERADAYDPDWPLDHVGRDGRVRPTWHQIGEATGRMSCSEPNLHEIPKVESRRACFAAGPGRVLVKAEPSQIELRIAAKISGDARMLAAYQAGEDLHTLTAATILAKPAADVTKSDRQLAKAVNYGLILGQGADGLKRSAKKVCGGELTLDDARRYRYAFFRTYPGLRQWHRRAAGNAAVDTRTLGGRRRIGVAGRAAKLNSPVQGTRADGLKAAIALLWERRAEVPSAVPVIFYPDEIVIECDAADAERAAAWLRSCTVDGMAPLIAPVPVEVEVTVGRTWAGN